LIIKSTIAVVSVVGILVQQSCGPQPDPTYCEDIEDVRTSIKQYADIDRASVEDEVLEDLNEMGATQNCPGYDPHDRDTDG
jgi:hypothetical protein